MKNTLATALTLVTLAGLVPRGSAVEVLVPINTNASTVRVELCLNPDPLIGQRCDNDTRPVTGYVLVDLDRTAAPTRASLRDFDARAMGPLNLNLVWFLVGRVDVTNRNLRIYHAGPGAANPYVPLTNSQVTFTNVPYQTEGTADYRISGALCGIVEGMGIPCVSNIDLSTLGANTADSVPGGLVISNGVLHLNLDLEFSAPLDPNNPTLGTLTGRALIKGTAPLNEPPTVALLSPTAGSVFAAGRPVPLQAQASDADGSVALVEFFAGTNKVGQATGPSFSYLWANPTSALHILTARATDNLGATAVSPPVPINVGVFPTIPEGSVWKYHDQGTNLGTTWRSRTYDDRAWAFGPAELGYGDDVDGRPEATVISYGPDANNKHITTYFRHQWVVLDRSLITGLTLRLLRDDGAVVYLNSFEVFRNNITNNPVNFTNLASATVAGSDETNFVTANITFSLSALQQGTNVLAVEVHQSSASSSDLSFDLELLAATRFSYSPTLRIQAEPDQTLTLAWPTWAVGYQLEDTASLEAPIGWTPVAVEPETSGPWKTVRVPAQAGPRFFRLQAD